MTVTEQVREIKVAIDNEAQARIDGDNQALNAISIERGSGIQNKKDGLMNNKTIGTYSRFHGMAYNGWIKQIIENAIQYHKIKK